MSYTTTTTAAVHRPHAHTRTHRLSRLERAALAALLIILLSSAVFTVRGQSGPGIVTRTHRVESGDTLWALASDNPVPGLDTARTVDLITDLNDLEGSELYAGSSILVPAAPRESDLAMR